MALGDLQDLNADMLMKITVNSTDVTLDQAHQDGSAAGVGADFGQHNPDITTVVLTGAGALMPAAGGSEKYRVRIERVE